MKVLIADDEPIQRDILATYCKNSGFFSEIACATNGLDALKILRSEKIDLLLCDIEMPQLNGLGLLKSVSELPPVILVTAYPDFAAQAFELDVVDYLLKPVVFERFLKAVDKAKRSRPSQLDDKPAEMSFLLKSGNTTHKILVSELCFLEAKGNYTQLSFGDGRKIQVYLSLTKVWDRLPLGVFVQVHRSFVVNKRYIQATEPTRLLVQNQWIPIGRSFKPRPDSLL